MVDNHNFDEVFWRLKSLLTPYANRLVVTSDQPANYYLDTPYLDKNNKRLFFGAVQVRKSYISFYLMPVYMFPGLLEGVSAGLRKRMQGKSCFNIAAWMAHVGIPARLIFELAVAIDYLVSGNHSYHYLHTSPA